MALLLGGIGVASAVVVFIRQRVDTIAVLRCLGATGGRVLAVYAAETAAMALAGGIVGAAAGVAAQQVLPALLAGLLPVDVTPLVSWRSIWLGDRHRALGGSGVRALPAPPGPAGPAARGVASGRRAHSPRRGIPGAGSSPWLSRAAPRYSPACRSGSWRRGAIFAAGIGGALLVLWGASWALVRAARRWLPGGWPYLWRQGLSNLHRPSNQTVTVVLAIGFGAFLLGTLVLVQSNLLRQLRVTGGPARPNLVLFDIQPDQLGTVRQALDSARSHRHRARCRSCRCGSRR